MSSEPAPTADPASLGALEADWAGACARIVAGQRELLEAAPGIADRTVYEGRGEGGDRSLAIDRRAEDVAFSELEALHADGHEFTAVSEERGTVRFGDGTSPVLVVIDPIDGSLNARRTIPSHAFSLAVASGPTMADVEFGYGLEIVGVESAKPERILPMLEELAGKAFRLRVVGSIAIAVSYVGAGRFDAMVTARACRSVDAAAAQLVAREAGAALEFPGFEELRAPLDLDARYHVTAALDQEMLTTLRAVQAHAPPAQ